MVTEQQLNLTGGVIAMNTQLMVELIMLILHIDKQRRAAIITASGTDCSDTISLETPPSSQRRRFFAYTEHVLK